MLLERIVTKSTSILFMLGSLLIILGGVGMLGWYTHTDYLVQIYSQFSPLQFNAALEFVLIGIALLLLRKYVFLSALIGLVVGAISGLTLAEYIFSVNLNIDEFFVKAYIATHYSFPGRMAPNTAFYFLIIGLILFIRLPFLPLPRKTLIEFSLSLFIAAVGVMALLGYVANVPTTYGWGSLAQMAVQTAVGFTLTGIGLSLFLWIDGNLHVYGTNIIAPVSILVLGSVFFILLWQVFIQYEHRKIHQATLYEATRTAKLLGLSLQKHLLQEGKAPNEDIKRIMEENIKLTVMEGYGAQLLEGDKILYQYGHHEQNFLANWNATVSLPLPGVQWQIRIWPTENSIQKFHSWSPFISVMTGFIIILLLTLVVRVLQVARQTSQQLELSQKKLNDTLEELKRSNTELEQFAYIASHDLQEPLRMVTSYTQLLAKRYKDKLDADANEFINYAVGGSIRMQTLLSNLLTYSRVTRQAKPLEPTQSDKIYDIVLTNLMVALKEKQATITRDALPTVMADPVQFTQLLQNLIANAIKFLPKDRTPKVHLSAILKDGEWLFSVKDNGIGIAKEYVDKIFVIFKRLHTQSEYAGTGIGLAVCKKIVERHGGRIWIESEVGVGTTFYFTIPQMKKE